MSLEYFIDEYFAMNFGGGMIPFDDAYWKAIDNGESPAVAQQYGVHAVVREFVKQYRQTQENEKPTSYVPFEGQH